VSAWGASVYATGDGVEVPATALRITVDHYGVLTRAVLTSATAISYRLCGRPAAVVFAQLRDDEGITWARGWEGPAVDALAAYRALVS
jgi:hypothetical protein